MSNPQEQNGSYQSQPNSQQHQEQQTQPQTVAKKQPPSIPLVLISTPIERILSTNQVPFHTANEAFGIYEMNAERTRAAMMGIRSMGIYSNLRS